MNYAYTMYVHHNYEIFTIKHTNDIQRGKKYQETFAAKWYFQDTQ